MNIVNVYSCPDDVGGAERSMHVGARALQAAGHRVYLLHGQADEPVSAAGYDGSLGLSSLFDRRSLNAPARLQAEEDELEEFLRRQKIDVLHVHGCPRSATLERWAQRHAVIVTVHIALCPNNTRYHWNERKVCQRKIGLGCLIVGYATKGCGHLGNGQPYGLPGFVRGMADDYILRRAIGRCARVIAPSHWIKERLVTDGISEPIFRVLEPPISEDGLAVDASTQDEEPVITFVGRLVDFKGPDQLLRASALMPKAHKVWLIGDGPMRPELEHLAMHLGIQERVTFFGALPPDQIKQYRLRSAAVVVPSLWPDNFPAVGPEAMLLHRPVVGYRVGGIPEWLKDGQTGFLVSPGDVSGFAAALEKILADPVRARAMGDAGAVLAREWVPENHAWRLVEIYQEAVAAVPGTAVAAVSGGACESVR